MKILEKALTQYGISEITGSKDHPQILNYFNALGYDGSKLHDETAWCSAFVGWVAKECDYLYSTKLTARSWLKEGISTDHPNLGDIVILWRESIDSWKGHVGFYIKESRNYIYLLGGNQNQRVCIKPYPKNRVLDYRILIKNG